MRVRVILGVVPERGALGVSGVLIWSWVPSQRSVQLVAVHELYPRVSAPVSISVVLDIESFLKERTAYRGV